jgi:putative flippase GtrA
MNPPAISGFVRWLRFNVVGLAGMLVQLVTLTGLNHIVPGRYLLVTAIAVETAVVHNFVAHVHYTWRERRLRSAWRDHRSTTAILGALWRFQISNGAVSLAGNMALMRLLVSRVHLPVLVANVIAIIICGLANFWLGDTWAFAAKTRMSAA